MAIAVSGSSTASRRNWWRKNQQRLAPWLFLAPGMLMFAVYVIWPVFSSLRLSLYDWDGLGARTWVGLGNFVELFDDEAFYTSLKNNIIWLVLYMLAVPAGLFIAIFLNQTVRGIRIYKSLFFFRWEKCSRMIRSDCCCFRCLHAGYALVTRWGIRSQASGPNTSRRSVAVDPD
jgi:multiple sugar transport system permease protein